MRIKDLFFSVALLSAIGFSTSVPALTVTGTVVDAEDGEPLAGANISVESAVLGASTGPDGSFVIDNVSDGATLIVSVVGYTTVRVAASGTVKIQLEETTVEVAALEVLAGRARFRETPVAFAEVSDEELKLKVASRDLPMVLNETPGVYASMQGGGSGDSRVNVRGFDQRNTAIMINGVPVNDMENGWVYWSNWDGMADVTSSIQVQRGLGASNLAVASVGGTVNIVTSAADQKKGFGFAQEYGSDNFLKSTLTAHTGRTGSGFATSLLLQKKVGNGFVDGTWTDAYSYFVTTNKSFGLHVVDLTLLGAPQQHGQRDGDNHWTEADWRGMESYDSGYGSKDYRRVNKGRTGSGWGYVKDANATSIKKGTDKSIDSISDALFGGIQHTRQIDGKWLVNNRTNYYHKPVYSLNWQWQINDKSSLSTQLYGSNGRGGGTGPLNSRGKVYLVDENGETIDEKSYKYINPNHRADGTYDWDDLIAYNRGNGGSGTFKNEITFDDADAYNAYTQNRWGENAPYDLTYSPTDNRSKYIIRASVNHHDWYGAISTLKYELSDNVSLLAGIDARSYSGEHYREVVNLLGGDYFIDVYGNVNDDTNDKKMKQIGDQIAYHNIGYNKWLGGFGQVEYTSGPLSAFGSAALSNTNYQREDFHNYTPGDQKSKTAGFGGSAVKVGANYNVNSTLNVFANLGALSIAPKFDAVYLNYVNDINPNAKNEKVNSAELGVGYRSSGLRVNANYYFTQWQDKQMVKYSNNLIYNISGLNAVHTGLELDLGYTILPNLNVNGAVSLGNWTWDSDVVADVASDNDRSGDTYAIAIYAGGLHVGDAPQTQVSAGLAYQPINGLTISPSVKYYNRHYADFDPADRDDVADKSDAYQLPSVMLSDLHVTYGLKASGFPVEIGFHLLNALDETYVSDAQDGSNHDGQSTKVFYGLGRRFNTSVNVRF